MILTISYIFYHCHKTSLHLLLKHFKNYDLHDMFRDGEDVNLHMKSAIEGAVIKWASQVNEVVQENSTNLLKSGDHPTPEAGKTNIYILFQ